MRDCLYLKLHFISKNFKNFRTIENPKWLRQKNPSTRRTRRPSERQSSAPESRLSLTTVSSAPQRTSARIPSGKSRYSHFFIQTYKILTGVWRTLSRLGKEENQKCRRFHQAAILSKERYVSLFSSLISTIFRFGAPNLGKMDRRLPRQNPLVCWETR